MAVDEQREHRWLGKSVARVEDERFVRGKGNYVDDIVLPGMLHMAILRSPFAHARILSIDTSRAQALEASSPWSPALLAEHNLAWMPTLSGDTQAVLATDKVRMQDQEVACVVAETPYIAHDALELIDVDYEPLPAVTTPQQALEAGAPIIRDDKEGQEDNRVYHWESGDMAATDAAFAAADRVVSLETHYRAAILPARVLRLRRRRQPGHRAGDDLHDLAGAARDPDDVRARRRPPGTEDPDRLPDIGGGFGNKVPVYPATSSRRRPRSCSGGR